MVRGGQRPVFRPGSDVCRQQRLPSRFVNLSLLWLQTACQLFTVFHLPSARDLPSIQMKAGLPGW